MKRRLSRRRFGSVLPLIVGESAMLVGCDAPLGPARSPSPARAALVSAASGPVAPFPLARSDLGRRGSAKLEYATLPAGGSLTLLSLDQGAGWVSHLWCAVSCADPRGRELTRYRVYVDGEATPSVDSTLVGFHAADAAPNQSFATRYLGYSHADTLNSYYAYLPLPFQSSIQIDVVNGSATEAALFFAIADYHQGAALAWGRARKLHTVEQDESVPAYAWHDVLNVGSPSGGVLGGVYLRLIGGDPSWGFLEGNVQVYVDGAAAPAYESSGTEDYFNNAWYFQTGVIFGDQTGCTRYDPASHTVGAYRFHFDDPIPFDRSLQVRWQNGTADQAKVVNPTALRSHVWYYTAER